MDYRKFSLMFFGLFMNIWEFFFVAIALFLYWNFLCFWIPILNQVLLDYTIFSAIDFLSFTRFESGGVVNHLEY